MGDDDVPTKIDALMDWQFFSGILKRGIGPQCYDPPVPFKCLLIGQWHAPSDAKLERALRVRLDFVVFCGLDLHAPLPDETTPCRFRNVLVRGGVYDDLPAAVCRRIEGHGLKLKEADAAFAIPALFDLLETEGRDDAVRIKGNPKLHDTDRMADQAPPRYTGFHYRAGSRSKARRVVARVAFHPGEPFPRVGFNVTDRSLSNERVPAFYNRRGAAERHIKEGKYALN